MSAVEIVHVGGERKTFEIEVYARSFVSIRWGLSGLYNISLKTGDLIAASASARRKGPCHWKVVDLTALRKHVWEYFNPNVKQEAEARFNQHYATMPYRKGT